MNKLFRAILIFVLILSVAVVFADEEIVEYAKPDVLVDTEWILENFDDENVIILEIAGNSEAYDEGHLPNAIFVPYAELTSAENEVRGQIVEAEPLAEFLSSIGVENDDTIILYDGSSNLFATRAYWTLKVYNHEDIRIYNGGTVKWLEDEQELVTDVSEIEESEYVIDGEPNLDIVADYGIVVENLDSDEVVFLDTRSPEEYAGLDVRATYGGHIPGAVNLNWIYTVQEDGTFLSAEELNDLYTPIVGEDDQIFTYCQTGVRGAHEWFILSELLGYDGVRNYDGSWEEYGNNEDSIVEQ